MPSKYIPKNTGYLRQPHSGKKAPPTGTDADLNLASLTKLFNDEDAARAFLESKVWKNGRHCGHCGCMETYPLTARPGSKSPVRPGVYKCRACKKQFTVRIGTIFEESKLPISKWLMAIHLMTSSKKGVSSHQIARELGITQKSAWFLNMRIREAMRQDGPAAMMSGIIEADESYFGGRPRVKNSGKRGRGTKKTPVMVLVQRDGSAICKPLENVKASTLRAELKQHVDPNSILMTDDLSSYLPPGKMFAAHETVNHSGKQYARVRPDGVVVHTNTAESFFALMKRGHYGIFHQLSKRHLHRYCDEFSFRWCYRTVSDGERMVAAIMGADGKRLMYR